VRACNAKYDFDPKPCLTIANVFYSNQIVKVFVSVECRHTVSREGVTVVYWIGC
jgi:hypothetical protein